MFSKIQSRLIRHGQQRLLQRLPVENINTHAGQIAPGMFGLLLKVSNPAVLIRNHNAEAAGFLHGNGHYSDGHLRVIGLVEVQHDLVIHLVNMIPGQNQYVLRVETLHIVQILVYGIGRTGIPFTVGALFVGRQHRHTADVSVQVPGNTDPDVGVQPQRLVLCQYAHRINTRIDTIAQGKVNNAVLPAESNRRLGNLGRKHPQTAALSSGQ